MSTIWQDVWQDIWEDIWRDSVTALPSLHVVLATVTMAERVEASLFVADQVQDSVRVADVKTITIPLTQGVTL